MGITQITRGHCEVDGDVPETTGGSSELGEKNLPVTEEEAEKEDGDELGVSGLGSQRQQVRGGVART